MTNTNENSYDHQVGLDRGEMVTFIVETTPSASPLMGSQDSIESLSEDDIASRISSRQNSTPLDECLHPVKISAEMSKIQINIPSPRDIVVMAAFPGESAPTIIQYPPSITRQKLSPGVIDIPIFMVDYVVSPIPRLADIECVISAMNRQRMMFEGQCCHEILLKAVRSQRNVIKTEFALDTLRAAMTLVEQGYWNSPDILLLNSDSLQVIREDIDGDGIYGLKPVLFNPNRRGMERRNYILSRSMEVGIVAKSTPTISVDRCISGDLSIHYRISMGAIITNRSAISSIDN